MKRLYSAGSLIQAHNLKNLLARSGIDVSLQGEALAGALGELPMNLVQVDVFVAEESYAEANNLLQKLLSDLEQPLEYWQCKDCGENNATSYEFCWQCNNDPSQ